MQTRPPLPRAVVVLVGLCVSAAPHGAGVPTDKLTEAASSVGIKRCLGAIRRLSALNVQGSVGHDVLLDWDRSRPDGGAVFALTGVQLRNAGLAATIAAIPEGDGGCTVSAERISVAPFTCASIAREELGGYRRTSLLPIFNVYTDDREPGSSVSLIDSAPGCLVIRRYTEYRWHEPPAAAAVPAARASAPR